MLQDVVEGFFESIGWGLGGAVVAGAVILGGPRAKPLAKRAIKGYLLATRRLRAAAAEAAESFQDLYAEAKHEYESQLRGEAASDGKPEASAAQSIRIERGDEPT